MPAYDLKGFSDALLCIGYPHKLAVQRIVLHCCLCLYGIHKAEQKLLPYSAAFYGLVPQIIRYYAHDLAP
jgi:hypothetical protein